MTEETLLMIYLGVAFLAALIAVRIATLRPVGDDLGDRLDVLTDEGTGSPVSAPAADRYARFEHRDYEGDRGLVPTGKPPATARWGGFVVPRWSDFYAETAARLGLDPLA